MRTYTITKVEVELELAGNVVLPGEATKTLVRTVQSASAIAVAAEFATEIGGKWEDISDDMETEYCQVYNGDDCYQIHEAS